MEDQFLEPPMEGERCVDEVRRRSLAFMLAAGAGIAMPGVLAPGLASAQSANQLRLGYQFHLWGAPAVVGLKRDFFVAEGVKVDSKRFASGTDARNAMIAGSVDHSRFPRR